MANEVFTEVGVQKRAFVSPKVILYGRGATGKSFSLATLLKNKPEARRLVYLMTERNAVSGFERGLQSFGIEPEEGDVIYVFPEVKKGGFGNLSRSIGTWTKESKTAALKGNNQTTQGKEHYPYLQNIINTLDNFVGVDYATQKKVKVGCVDDLDGDDILIIDGLTPIATEVWHTTVGDKIAVSQGDYMPAQKLMFEILSLLSGLTCPVILLAHEKPLTEVEKVNGIDNQKVLMESVINTGVGNANYEMIRGCFTDIIHTYKFGTKFFWETKKTKVDGIGRNFTEGTDLVPDFSLYDAFK